MIPKTRQNRKMSVDVSCPGCGRKLDAENAAGFIKAGATYCCEGCATGTGCTCAEKGRRRKSFNRPGDLGQRNPENTVGDANQNQEVTSSGRWFSNRKETRKAPSRWPNRGDELADHRKAPRSQSEERPSTREQARGRSEFRGSLSRGKAGTPSARIPAPGRKVARHAFSNGPFA